MQEQDCVHRICIVGDREVGKSVFYRRLWFEYTDCKSLYPHITGTEVQVINTSIPDTSVPCRFFIMGWHGERDPQDSDRFFSNASGIILLFDLTRPETLANIHTWVDLADEKIGRRVPMVLCGNKCDLPYEIEESKIQVVAEKYEVPYFLVTSDTNVFYKREEYEKIVYGVILRLARMILDETDT